MKILIDIGHPAHVHYFRNFINKMKEREHEFLIVARDRGIIKDLLIKYDLEFVNRGKGNDSLFGKFTYMFIADYKILKVALKFKPDLFLSFSSPYAAQVAFFLRKPHVALNDTEHTDKMHTLFTYPFSSSILTPESYRNDLGKKQIRFNSVVENLYLNKQYFKSSDKIKMELGLKKNEKYAIIRFVSWHAYHDFRQQGIDILTAKKLINVLEEKYKIFVSSEDKLPIEFEKYKINISSNKMHHVLANASIFIGESATMSSESTLLGTKAVYINSLPLMGYLKLEQEAGLLKYFDSTGGVIEYVEEIINDPNLKSIAKQESEKMQKDFINPTKFLIWFVEHYPESIIIMKNNPSYQEKFV